MENRKNQQRPATIFGLKIGEFIALLTFIIGICVSVIEVALYVDHQFTNLNGKMDKINANLDDKIDKINANLDAKIDKIDAKFEARFDSVDHRLNKIDADLKKTSNLLDVYLTWRFLYVTDPTRKNLLPRYDPNTRTLEFIDKQKGSGE